MQPFSRPVNCKMLSTSTWTIIHTSYIQTAAIERGDDELNSISITIVDTIDVVTTQTTAMETLLQTYGPIEQWKTQRVRDFSNLFNAKRNPKAATITLDLSQWDVSNAESLIAKAFAISKRFDMMLGLDTDPFEMNSILGFNAMNATDATIIQAEHMRCLLLDWMTRLDGTVVYYSDPATNYGQSNGDISKIRDRQSWKAVGVWTSSSDSGVLELDGGCGNNISHSLCRNYHSLYAILTPNQRQRQRQQIRLLGATSSPSRGGNGDNNDGYFTNNNYKIDPKDQRTFFQEQLLELEAERTSFFASTSTTETETIQSTSTQSSMTDSSSNININNVSSDGNSVQMVDVGNKAVTQRTAHAQSKVILPGAVLQAFSLTPPLQSTTTTSTSKVQNELIGPKGPIFATAKIAGIMAAKQTSNLVPLCHPLPIDQIIIDIVLQRNTIIIDCTCRVTHKTGVEMEALTGATVAALTIYDMVKANPCIFMASNPAASYPSPFRHCNKKRRTDNQTNEIIKNNSLQQMNARQHQLMGHDFGRLMIHALSYLDVVCLLRKQVVSKHFKELCNKAITAKCGKDGPKPLSNIQLQEAIIQFCEIMYEDDSNKEDMEKIACTYDFPIDSWNVSQVTDMSALFPPETLFDEFIGSWDISNVIDMSSMFCPAIRFNQDIGRWDVSNVRNIRRKNSIKTLEGGMFPS
ncbi:molybdenum cofactor biosynthesis protein C [Nitzschia inconspicua]|uniref:Molybdenum cofactor biosynthesis protein C n=1 Tax=Nitzschia inconspicua TaxID=303405 RepID=A0A9K3Q5A4_9STRA|nr:molybdenum cofactor biosynthesis protein C [Nitzschia inconspicua]